MEYLPLIGITIIAVLLAYYALFVMKPPGHITDARRVEIDAVVDEYEEQVKQLSDSFKMTRRRK